MADNVTKIKVSADHMESNYDSLSSLRNKLTDNSKEIMDLVKFIGTFYQGPAYDAFVNAVSNGMESIKEFSSYMDNFLDAYSEADKKYKETERKVYNYVHDL